MSSIANPILCLLLLFGNAVGFGPPQDSDSHDGKIETKYDGFAHETVVSLKKMSVSCRSSKGFKDMMKNTCVSIAASLHAPGKQLEYVRYARVQLIFESKEWDWRHPFGQRDLSVVADNESLKLGTMKLMPPDRDNIRHGETIREVLEISIPYQAFTKMARAEVVEMKVGNSVFELSGKNLMALRDMKNRILTP